MNLLVSPDNEATTIEEELAKHQPYVVMVVGVNGVGKTTTVGKLAHQFKSSGKKVMLVQRIPLEQVPLINCKSGQIV
jgi:fused signal recognition particle receptor